MSTWPTHYRDNGSGVCNWSGTERRDDNQGCPNGCSGATEHYSNDGHPECDDSPEELAKLYAAMSRVHAAKPVSETDDHCRVCGQHTKRVPGGQGPTWVHRDTGAVAAPNPPRS